MITPIRTMTIKQICERNNDLLISSEDVKKLARSERNNAIDEFVNRLEKHQQENWVDNLEYGITWSDIELIAKQMKEGGKNAERFD